MSEDYTAVMNVTLLIIIITKTMIIVGIRTRKVAGVGIDLTPPELKPGIGFVSLFFFSFI